MISIISTDASICISKQVIYDASSNPIIEVDLSITKPLFESQVVDLETRVINLETSLNNIKMSQLTEEKLKQEYPALNDQFEKYKVMLGLVIEASNSE